MTRSSEARIIRKRARKFHKFVPILSQYTACGSDDLCDACMAQMRAQVDNERPGHVWRAENGQIFYKEDKVAEKMLGRKLKPTESVVIKNGNYEDCRPENLEVVEIPDLGF